MSDIGNPDALASGTLIQEFKIVRAIGEGAFAIVYLAENQYLPETVAIKEFFHTELARRMSDGTVSPRSESAAETYRWALGKFLEEAQIIYELGQPNGHPNIVRVRRFHEANGTAYMVMDFEDGESLEERLEREGTLSEQALVAILKPLLDALDWAHSKSVWHRDIKPANILIRTDGAPVLFDFGAARKDRGDGAVSRIAVFTPNYAAPEQELGRPDTMGPWTDIYSLGATLYRAVVGHPPTNSNQRALKAEHATAAEAARDLGYSAAFLAAIDRALELSPENRPQSVAEWRNDFQRLPELVHALSGSDTVIRPLPVVASATGDNRGSRPGSVPMQTRLPERNHPSGSPATDAPDTKPPANSSKRLAVVIASMVMIGLATIGTILFINQQPTLVDPLSSTSPNREGDAGGQVPQTGKPNMASDEDATTGTAPFTVADVVNGLAQDADKPPSDPIADDNLPEVPSAEFGSKPVAEPPGDSSGSDILATLEPPAPTVPIPNREGVLADAQRLVKELECASLVVELTRDSQLKLFGFLMTQGDLDRLKRQLSALDGVTKVDDDVRIVAKPFCQVLGVLVANTGGAADGPGIEPENRDGIYREGQFLRLDAVATNAFDGYLYVDYVDGEGNVLHFLPSARFKNNRVKAGQKILLGRNPRVEVGPPHGESMFIAISSEQALFDEVRPEVEQIGQYLPALEARLRALSTQSGNATKISSTTRFIVTTP